MEGIDRLNFLFKNVLGNRFRICYGPGIDDIFINEKGIELNFEQALYETLLRKGYSRVIFFSPHRSLYSHDNRSLMFEGENRQHPQFQMEMGPLKDYAAFRPTTSQTDQRNGMGDVHALRIIDTLMHDDLGPQTAVVFLQAETSLKSFEDHRTLSGLIGEWLHLSSQNHNICIYSFSIDDYEELHRISLELPVPELRIIIQREKERLDYVSNPEADEIERGLRELSTVNKKINDHKDFSKKLLGEGRSLRSWKALWKDPRLNNKDLTFKLAGELGWFDSVINPDISAREKLNSLIGLENVKKRIDELIALMKLRKKSSFKGETFPNLHMIFSGNPGTGKTTVARLIGELYHEMGWLKRGHLVEVQAGSLIADFVGGTATKTNQLIDQALEGVLFIDEAYGLTSKDRGGYNQEALEILLSRMETDRSRLVVICAGYGDKMIQFRQANPGLTRRFPEENIINFEDYDGVDLLEILKQMICERNLLIDMEIETTLKILVSEMLRKRDPYFGNAGEMRNLTDGMERLHASRMMASALPADTPLTIEDIPNQYQSFIPIASKHQIVYEWINEFNNLVGLKHVKENFQNLTKRLEFDRLRFNVLKLNTIQPQIGNYIFVGNPGTGKTTVARLLGKIYRELGLLSKGQTIEVSRADLIAGFVGQTATKVQDVIQRALDGILFIDEAYSLNGSSENDYGSEAIDTLIKGMENFKGRLCVVLAGYPDEMNRLLLSNPGLKSRFGFPIFFPDFTLEELCEILKNTLLGENYHFDEGFLDVSMKYIEWMQVRDGSNFGNARSVYELFELIKSNAANRILKLIETKKSEITAEILSTLQIEDIPEPGFYLELNPVATTNAKASSRV